MSVLAINGGSPVRLKPFPSWPVWGEEEIKNLTEVVRSGQWGRLKGKKTEEFERKFADLHKAEHGICVNSGTTALRLALTAAGLEPGTEVIVPAYTFIASATVVIEAGCLPVFVDIDPETYTLDVRKTEEAITKKTSALMPVHFAGRPADMDSLLALARKHDLKVIEDAAQAWAAEWKGVPVGALGDAGCFSFQASKNITAGEGGIILTNDDRVARMARSHHNCGRSEDGQWYEHFYLGGNSRITEFQSAVLLAQLDRFEELQKIRKRNLNYLDENLAKIEGVIPLAEDGRITNHACHLYVFRYKKEFFYHKPKDAFLAALRAEGIPASPGYSLPLYRQPVLQNKAFGPWGRQVDFPLDYSAVSCPETERACQDEAIWLTQNILLGTEEDMDDILAAIQKIKDHAPELKI